jgi:superoxide reductase
MLKVYVFKCDICGNIVEILHEGSGRLVCCGKEMTLIEENTVEASREKHIPVVTKVEGGIKVSVGSVAHPMLDNHYIEWIEVITMNRIYRAHLKPNMVPEATFKIDTDEFYARAYCNLHGLWKGE